MNFIPPTGMAPPLNPGRNLPSHTPEFGTTKSVFSFTPNAFQSTAAALAHPDSDSLSSEKTKESRQEEAWKQLEESFKTNPESVIWVLEQLQSIKKMLSSSGCANKTMSRRRSEKMSRDRYRASVRAPRTLYTIPE